MCMKKIKITLLYVLGTMVLLSACVKDVPLEIQKPFTYDEQYHENLRAYKKSEHNICFGWMASYAPIAGASGYKDPASWGERIIGIPDSMDIVSLWMGIPSNDSTSPSYAPVAYADMHYVRRVKGTRFVCPVIVAFRGTITMKDGTVVDLSSPANRNDEGIAKYGQWLVDQVLDNDLDGLDIDWEPAGGEWLNSPNTNFVKLVEYVGQFFGPKGIHKDKLFIIDFFTLAPPVATGQYADYFIRQAYSQGTGGIQTATNLQNNYNAVQAAVPPSKFIVTENFGDFAENGGTPFTEANGNLFSSDGTRMHSLEGMARWNPTQGRKAGFGAFYFCRDYYSKTGIPYYNMRRAIQIANPAAK